MKVLSYLKVVFGVSAIMVLIVIHQISQVNEVAHSEPISQQNEPIRIEAIDWSIAQIEISTEKQLRDFANQVNSGNNLDYQTVILTNNIVIEEGEWIPIGNNHNNQFRGIFDGNGMVISGIYGEQGLFGFLGQRGEIRRVGVVVDINGRNGVGGIAGSNVGGIIGNSYAVGTVAGNQNVGGLVGSNVGGAISNSYALGNVTGRGYVGGLVGTNVNGGTIRDSYASGAVTESGRRTRELIGENDRGSGGMVCRVSDMKTSEQMKNQDTYRGWNFSTIWGIAPDKNDGFPYLQSNR